MTCDEKTAYLRRIGVRESDAKGWDVIVECAKTERLRVMAADPDPPLEQSVDRTRLKRIPDGSIVVAADTVLAIELRILQLEAHLADLMVHVVRGSD